MINLKEEILLKPSKITAVVKYELKKCISNGFFKERVIKETFYLRIEVDNNTDYGRTHSLSYDTEDDRDAEFKDLFNKLKDYK